VAVEHRDTPLEGRAELRRVPVALTSGWGGMREQSVNDLCAPQMDMLAISLPAMRAPARLHGSFDVMSLDAGASYDQATPMATLSSPRLPARSRARGSLGSRPHAQLLRPLDALVALQRADGSWELDGEFAKAVSLELVRLEQKLRTAAGDAETVRRALATAIALEWLEKHAGAQRGEWELLAKKATNWLSASRTEPAAGQGWSAWLDAARRLL
jgi:hypothetical protein